MTDSVIACLLSHLCSVLKSDIPLREKCLMFKAEVLQPLSYSDLICILWCRALNHLCVWLSFWVLLWNACEVSHLNLVIECGDFQAGDWLQPLAAAFIFFIGQLLPVPLQSCQLLWHLSCWKNLKFPGSPEIWGFSSYCCISFEIILELFCLNRNKQG